jgi:hypothetical protein
MPRTSRPKLPPVSEEMRRVFALLAEELAMWPDVNTKLMFGLRAIYRKKIIFALLPDKRSLEVADAVAYKEGGKWKLFEMRDEGGVSKALELLRKAYNSAARKRVLTARRSSDNPG